MSQNYWSPFRDWNQALNLMIREAIYGSQNYWSPFRDWNTSFSQPVATPESLKTTEALLGIETWLG